MSSIKQLLNRVRLFARKIRITGGIPGTQNVVEWQLHDLLAVTTLHDVAGDSAKVHHGCRMQTTSFYSPSGSASVVSTA